MSVYIGFYYGDTSNRNHTLYPFKASSCQTPLTSVYATQGLQGSCAGSFERSLKRALEEFNVFGLEAYKRRMVTWYDNWGVSVSTFGVWG